MSGYRLYKHKGYERSARNLPATIRQKALWSQVLLGIRGRTPTVKSTSGFDLRWRRTPVQGNHYYMWWIPYSESRISAEREQNRSILVHSIRHHDQNSAPILAGTLDDYDELPVAEIDPRFDEQWQIVEMLAGGPDQPTAKPDRPHFNRPVALSTVKGLPGSGKTVSLYYLVRDLVQQIDRAQSARGGQAEGDILYITYTSRLKRAALEFLQAQGSSMARRVRVQTLNEVQSEITQITTYAEPFGALSDFYKFLNVQNSSSLGPWKRYPQTLYTEIRAHLLGKTFPDHYVISPTYSATKNGANDRTVERYAKNRKIDEDAAKIAFNISERAAASRFFHEQTAAQSALGLVSVDKHPDWIKDLNAIIVDEVQDLTLIQLAFLGELARAALQQGRNGYNADPFFFTIAGDESQVVQPTGFDWGVTKDLLSEQLGAYPSEYEFQHQRRSPRLLAQIIDNSWRFYRHLPKSHRPSARSDSFVDASIATEYQFESAGQVLICSDPTWQLPTAVDEFHHSNRRQSNQISSTIAEEVRVQGRGALTARFQPGQGPDWQTLVDELTEKPGRVLIDMTETLRASLPEQMRATADDILFLPREIKGLERATVILYGLNAAYERACLLSGNDDEDNIPRYEARRIFDEMRVALSRSTARLVLLEPTDAPVLAELGIDPSTNVQQAENSLGGGLLALGWGDLLETLRTEEMAELEVIEGYLDEVEDLAERGRWKQAYRRNRRAYELAVRLDDVALQRETQEQHIDLHIQESNTLYQQKEWSAAYQRNRAAHKLAVAHGDPMPLERVNEQRTILIAELVEQATDFHKQALQWAKSNGYKPALQNAEDALKLAKAVEETELISEIEQTIARICRQWAYQLTDPHTAGATRDEKSLEEAITLLDRGQTLLQKIDPNQSKALQIVADRYRSIPPAMQQGIQQQGIQTHLSKTQLSSILDSTRQYLGLIEQAKIIVAEPNATVETDFPSPKPPPTEDNRPVPQFIAELSAQFDAQQSEDDNTPQPESNAAEQELSAEMLVWQELYRLPRRWLDESFAALDNHASLYYLWAVTAEQWIRDVAKWRLDYPEFDEQLWELENRMEMIATDETAAPEASDAKAGDAKIDASAARFDAFILSYHGEAAQASAAWEKLGEIEFAAQQARNAGEIERAYDLLRRSDQPIPEALTLATKSLRQLEQLAQHPEALRPEEREALAEQLRRIQTRLEI